MSITTPTTTANATCYVDAAHTDEGTRVRVLSTDDGLSFVWDGERFEFVTTDRITEDKK